MMKAHRSFFILTCAMFTSGAILVAGCGGPGDTPEMGTVSGTVKMDGKPLADALITFIPQDHEKARDSYGTTDENGYYELKYSLRETGAMLGNHKVTISTAMSEGEYSEDGGGEKVPAKYNVNTELTAKVEPGSNEINFLDLTSEGEIIEVDDTEVAY